MKGFKPFTLFKSDTCGIKENIEYKYKADIRNLDDLISATRYDTVPCEFTNNIRSKENFVSADCIQEDIDNSHSDEEQYHYTEDDLAEDLPEVKVALTASRNHMKPKQQEDGSYKSPRYKKHLCFPLSKVYTNAAEYKRLKVLLNAYIPLFDPRCSDIAHYMNGCKAEYAPSFIDGDLCIDEYFAMFPENELLAKCIENLESVKAKADQAHEQWPDIALAYKKLANEFNLDLPEWVIEWTKETAKHLSVGEGRHNRLVWLLGYLVKSGVRDRKELTDKIYEANNEFATPLPEDEVEHEVLRSMDDFIRKAEKEEQPIHDGIKQYRENKKDMFPDVYIWSEGKGGKEYRSEINDDAAAEYLKDHFNLFCKNEILYMYDESAGVYRCDPKGKYIMTALKNLIIPGKFRKYEKMNGVIKLLKSDSEIMKTDDDINQYSDTAINFTNGLLEVTTGKMVKHSAKQYSINQIPHVYVEGVNENDSVLYQFLSTRLFPDDIQMLFAFIGMCMTKGYVFQNFIIFSGDASMGKSKTLKCIENVIGKDNRSSISLHKLSDRFAPSLLYDKILNTCGDLKESSFNEPDMIKLLTGDDMIYAEFKGIDGFFFRNRAKMIFSANKLPIVKNEHSNGYYRRLLVIEFHQGDYIDDLDNKLNDEREIERVISLSVKAFKEELIATQGKGSIRKSKRCIATVNQLRKDSDSVFAFINECCNTGTESMIPRNDLYEDYQKYCLDLNISPLGNKSFYTALRLDGYPEKDSHGVRYFYGISTK